MRKFQDYNELMAAHVMLGEYLEIKSVLRDISIGTSCNFEEIEIEAFSEQWTERCATEMNDKWKLGAQNYFIQLYSGFMAKQRQR